MNEVAFIERTWFGRMHPARLDAETRARLPHDSACFLEEVGLPDNGVLHHLWTAYVRATSPIQLRFLDPDLVVPKIVPTFDPDAARLAAFREMEYLRIGDWSGADIGVAASSGEVYLVWGERPDDFPEQFPFEPISFLNSTFQKYLCFLGLEIEFLYRTIHLQVRYNVLHDAVVPQLKALPEIQRIQDEIESIHIQLSQRLYAMDRPALERPDSWWRDHLYLQRKGL